MEHNDAIHDISVIIVNWNTCDLLQRCIASIRQHTPPETDYEIIVVDNGSTDASVAMLQERFPSVRLLRNQKNHGFATANNQGVAHSNARYVLLLNSDTELISDVLTGMLTFMDAQPTVGICAPKLLNSDGSRQVSCDAFPRTPFNMLRDKIREYFQPTHTSSWRHRMTRRDFTTNFAIDYVTGAALLIRHETLEQIGGLDEQFFMYAEDIDWCYRTALQGWQTYYLGTLSLYHHNRGSSEKTPELAARLQAMRKKSLIQFYRKHYGICNAVLLFVIANFRRETN